MVDFSTNTNLALVNQALFQGGLTILVSLIAVALTESRMGRSRGRFSLICVFAPIGTIGFLGVLKVHIASLVSNSFAREINLPVNDYASASRIGSVRKMNAPGIEWDKPVNCLEIGMDETTPVKSTDGFVFTEEGQVSYISSNQRVDIIQHRDVVLNNRHRFKSTVKIFICQAIFCFGITIGSEYAAQRETGYSSLALFFSASVVLTQLCTSITEWLWTSLYANDTIMDKPTAKKHDAIQSTATSDRRDKTVRSMRIYEQKMRIRLQRSGLRLYNIRRQVQLRMHSFAKDMQREWTIEKSKRILFPHMDTESEKVPNKIVYPFFLRCKAAFILALYYTALIIGICSTVAEIFTYIFYVTSSFIDPNLNDINSQRRGLQKYGRWFSVQLLGFLLKAIAPWIDKHFTTFNSITDRDFGQLWPEPYSNDIRLGDKSARSGISAQLALIRAGSKNGVLLQTIEQDTTLPPAFASFVRLTNGNRNATVVPQILLVSGNNALHRIKYLGEKPLRWNSDTVKKIAKTLDSTWQVEERTVDKITSILNEEKEIAEKITQKTKHLLEEINRNKSDSDTLLVCEFVPYRNANKKNPSVYVRIASIKKEAINENHHFRIVTLKKTRPRPGNEKSISMYKTSFVAWQPFHITTMSQEVEQANVLYFNQAEVNTHEDRRLMIKRDAFSGISVPLPEKWGFDIQENWIEENTNQSKENNEENNEVSLGLHLLERWAKKKWQECNERQEINRRPGDNNLLPALNAEELDLLQKATTYLEKLREKLRDGTNRSNQQREGQVQQQAQQQNPQPAQQQDQQPAQQIPTSTEGFFEYLEPSELNIERGISRRPTTFMAEGFKYVGRLYVSECYIHRYFNIITSQGWLTESEKQVFGDIYHIGNSENLSPVVSRGSMA